MQLVRDLVRLNRQHVFLLRHEQVIVLVEVEDEGGEKGGFLSNVGEGMCHHLVNQQPPIYRLGSGHCSKQGVNQGKATPFGLVQIQDG